MSIPRLPDAQAIPPPADVNLKDYLDVLRRRKAVFIQVFFLVVAVGIVITALARPVYLTRAKLRVPTPSSTVNIVDTKNPLAGVLAQYQPDSVDTQIELLQSEPFLERAREAAKVRPRPDVEPPLVRVEAIEKTNIIQVTVEGGDPREIAGLANAIVEQHSRETDSLSSEGLRRTLDLTVEQRDVARRSLDHADRQLLSFRRAHRVAQLSAEQEGRVKEFVELQAQVRAAETNIAGALAQVGDLRGRLKREPVSLVDEVTQDNPRLARLQERLDELILEKENLAPLFRPASREMQAVEEQIAAVRQRLAAEPRVVVVRNHLPNPARPVLQSRLAEREAALEGYHAELNAARARLQTRSAQMDAVGTWEVELARLTAERDAALAAYTLLADQARDLRLRASAQMPGARVIERAAIPTAPVRPRKVINLALTVILALFLAAGLAFLQEYLDDRINSPDDIERISAMPALGHVPLISADQPRLVSALPANSHVAESYRALRSSIGFAGIDQPIRRLQVTSASKGEGKTVTSINLATAMAMDGKNVILVDADMRRPSIHRVLNLPNSPGLSEALAGLKDIQDAVQPTDIENLRVVAAGPIPPNPAELLGSRTFDRLLQELEEQCDVLVFDSPPCIPVTDPLIIAARMEGVVLVVHAGHTKKAALKHVEELLQRARARIVGVIFNRVQASKAGYYYYHYYYYYGDGYYSDAATRGEQRRRNGRGRLGAGVGASAGVEGEDRPARRLGTGDEEERA